MFAKLNAETGTILAFRLVHKCTYSIPFIQ